MPPALMLLATLGGGEGYGGEEEGGEAAGDVDDEEQTHPDGIMVHGCLSEVLSRLAGDGDSVRRGSGICSGI